MNQTEPWRCPRYQRSKGGHIVGHQRKLPVRLKKGGEPEARRCRAVPYIAESELEPYDQAAKQLLSALDPAAWREQLAPVICQIGRRIYGDPDSTRYSRQNEFLGVLACAANEWQDRLCVPAYGADASLSFDPLGITESAPFEDMIVQVADLLAKEGAKPGPPN